MKKSKKKSEPNGADACWNCADDPDGKLKQMFVDIVQTRRIKQGQTPARRPVFLKPHGVACARFEVRPDLPKDLRVGVFALKEKEFPAWIRFSSDTIPTNPDLKTTCGVGIKLFNVPGEKLMGDGNTHDFILQNHDVFFVDTAEDMCEFTKAGVVQGDYDPYLNTHPVTKRILDEMEKVELSVLTATYWSVLPYAFGKDRYVKYKLEPEQIADGEPPIDVNDYLATDLALRLRTGEARFRFLVQLRTNDQSMPLDAATVRWSESESEPLHVGTLILPRQDIRALGQANYGENLAFNPWHCLREHEPVGSISQARRLVYASSATERRNVNGVTTREPDEPKPIVVLPPVDDDCIVKAAIYPGIGVARLGNSDNDFFIGPEVPDPVPEAPGFYRGATGALKRQAARFRIYGLNAEGRAVRELTAAEAKIEWTVHLANKKSAWYQFQLALDIPEAPAAPPSLLRNAAVPDRSQLVIDPGARTIEGRNQSGGKKHTFDTGKFMGTPVYLGEVRTDEAGRLIVLGGRGKSASFDGTVAITFANNEGWHDDISDGPVTAKVTYQGQKLNVAPAWVIVGPPNYAPMQKSVRTMWDVMRDVAISANMLTKPARPSFDQDIRPLFERMSNLQWVNAGFAAAFGWRSPNEWTNPEVMARLADPSPNSREMRLTLGNHFRDFNRDSWSPTPWPWLYGDAMNIPPAETPRQNAALTDTQLGFLKQWAMGDFDADYDPNRQPPRRIEEVPVADQPATLDKASMEHCLADAFHPGCEMTWPMRDSMMYMAAFRLDHADADWIEPQYGAAITQDTLTLPNGPMAGQVPGGVTRWMAVPWQTDTASCRSGYLKSYDPYVPTFWPARVPNQVLTKESYDVVMDKDRPMGERLAAFANRASWLRGLGTKSYTDQINNMIRDYGKLGVVEVLPGPGDPDFPETMEVEQLPPSRMLRKAIASLEEKEIRGLSHEPDKSPEDVDLTGIEKVHRFPYGLRRR
ncbi:MAG TPA: LodA/GoxA family CTQ-dependent oxidase [Pyrinomonadaceae bacterium]|nr:LodA/GoxA family CTQ-dependent oxidase [Pyrinomonadaceae bacterium]